MYEEFIKDRNEAFASGDKEQILAYCKKYNVKIPEDEETFWIGVHKTICHLRFIKNSPISKSRYEESYNWLHDRGYNVFSKDGGKK